MSRKCGGRKRKRQHKDAVNRPRITQWGLGAHAKRKHALASLAPETRRAPTAAELLAWARRNP